MPGMTFPKVKVNVPQSCPILWDPIHYTVRGTLQARVLEWVAFPFSRGSSQPGDWTKVSCPAVDSLPTERWGQPHKRWRGGLGFQLELHWWGGLWWGEAQLQPVCWSCLIVSAREMLLAWAQLHAADTGKPRRDTGLPFLTILLAGQLLLSFWREVDTVLVSVEAPCSERSHHNSELGLMERLGKLGFWERGLGIPEMRLRWI